MRQHQSGIKIRVGTGRGVKGEKGVRVVGQTNFDDYLHIAAATISKADILVSWNFKHIVNV